MVEIVKYFNLCVVVFIEKSGKNQRYLIFKGGVIV